MYTYRYVLQGENDYFLLKKSNILLFDQFVLPGIQYRGRLVCCPTDRVVALLGKMKTFRAIKKWTENFEN